MPYAQANGITMHYEVKGQGSPLVLVGGLGSDGHLWYRQTPALARRFRVITPDNRGAGESGKPDEPYTLAMMAADIVSLMDILGVLTASIVGASMGGAIAQEVALAHPGRVNRLILCCTSFGGPDSLPIPDGTMRILQRRTGDPEQDLRTFLTVQFATDYLQAHAEEIDAYVAWRVARPQPVFAYQRQLAASLAHNTEDRLAGLRCPTLVMHGAQDRVVPADNARRLAARIPNAVLHVLPDAGHLFLWERADEANRLMVEFLGDR